MNRLVYVFAAAAAFVALATYGSGIEKWDPAMAANGAEVDESGVKWIDGRNMPIEGRAYDDVEAFYDRLPAGVTTNVNGGVRSMKHHTAGMQLRFTTDSDFVAVKFVNYNASRGMYHMPELGASGIDIYRQDDATGKWRFVKSSHNCQTKKLDSGETARIVRAPWKKGEACLVNLPLYNGISRLWIGVAKDAKIGLPPSHRSGVVKPVVFYGTSITHGGCASRAGLAFPSIIGRDLDVPIVNLGFSGSGVMEFEMSEHIARIDASCYVLDCLWNMSAKAQKGRPGRSFEENYEKFIRNLRAKRPDVPIVMAEQSDVYKKGRFDEINGMQKALYEKLVAEGWKNLVYLPADDMFDDSLEGTVDGCHPNDLGMVTMAKAYGRAVAKALNLRK